MKLDHRSPQAALMSAGATFFVAIMLQGCGFLDHKETTPGKSPTQGFNLTATETTLTSTDALKTFLNTDSFLGSLNLGKISPEKPAVPSFSRVSSSDFARCVAAQLNAVPLRVTLDTLALEFDFDFVQLCDRTPQQTDRVTEVANRVKGAFVVTCGGGDFAGYKGRTWGDLSTLSVMSLCGPTSEISWSASQELSARIVKSAQSTDQENVVSVRTFKSAVAGSANNSCRIKIDENGSASEQELVARDCRLVWSSVSFDGPASAESRSPNASETPRPLVTQGEVVLKDARMRQRDPWFHDSMTSFTYNNWTGTVTTSNGWAKPTWNATAADGTTASGTLSEINSGSSSTGDTSPAPPLDSRTPRLPNDTDTDGSSVEIPPPAQGVELP